jgi:hypothetical protein
VNEAERGAIKNGGLAGNAPKKEWETPVSNYFFLNGVPGTVFLAMCIRADGKNHPSTIKHIVMKKLVLFLALYCCAAALSAQRTVYWIGGKPGQATDWNCAANWSTGQVPSTFDEVWIPDVSTNSGFYPVIDEAVEPIRSLNLLSNAYLYVLPEGTLTVYTWDPREGIQLQGNLMLDGNFYIHAEERTVATKADFAYTGRGTVIAMYGSDLASQ